MTLRQLNRFKRWHLAHSEAHPVEFQLCDLVLGAWVSGWMLLPTLVLLDAETVMPASLLLILTPELYVGLRRTLHQRGLLRCDWAEAQRSW
jgi:hypothetical protein